MGESRQELLAWVNDLLQTPTFTKIEHMGTGAALCQIYDSIFGDVQISRCRLTATAEWEYIDNFKILQNTFTKHGVERTVPVLALTKCKMQDNLEFLQWTKRFWDQYFPGGEYDALKRREGRPIGPGKAKTMSSGARSGSSAARRTPTTGAAPRLGAARTGGAAPRIGTGARAGAAGGAVSAALTQENDQLKETVQGLERERDFYFSKLRDIELLIQQAVDENPEIEKDETSPLKSIQEILYSTEEGFEIPAEGEGEEGVGEDLETF